MPIARASDLSHAYPHKKWRLRDKEPGKYDHLYYQKLPMSADPEVATTTFTYFSLETEMQHIREMIKTTRENPSLEGLSPEIRDWWLSCLMELHNTLDVESVRQQEKHLQLLMNSLQLEAIGAKASILGGLKAHLTEASSDAYKAPRPVSPPPQATSEPAIAVQGGFVDPLYGSGPAMGSASAILLAHKKELTQRLIVLNRKSRLTSDEEAEKKQLIEELRKINGTE